MEKNTTAAIMGAIIAYIQQEEAAKTFANIAVPVSGMNPWWHFGHQEMVRARTSWRVRRTGR